MSTNSLKVDCHSLRLGTSSPEIFTFSLSVGTQPLQSVLADLYELVPCLKQFREKDKQIKDRMKKNYDNRRGARTKPSCEVGDEVFLPGERVKGKIIARRPEPRSFDIDTPSGVIRRNKAQFNKLPRYKFKAQFQHPCMLPGMSTTDKQVKQGPLSGVVSPASIPERRRPEPRKSVQKPRPHDETKSSRASSFNRMLQGFLGSSPPKQPRRSDRENLGVPPDRSQGGGKA